MHAEPGVDPHRVAEVIVTGPDGTRRRGSGYRVASGVVLTAAHVVDGARDVVLRFDADTHREWSTPAVEVVADPKSDLAAVLIDAPGPVTASSYGRVGDRADVISVRAVGFPRFKLKGYGGTRGGIYRDSHQANGAVAPLSNLRSKRLEVEVAPPEYDPDPLASPWEGMSGAALWAGHRIVGVVTDHHRGDGLRRLAAARISALTDGPAGDEAPRLRAVLGLPPTGLPDVGVPVRSEASYLLQVGDIAPERLFGRQAELAELAAFTGPYGWWEGAPWAGKTALMARFALDPPEDVDVVAFFGGAGSSDGEAFLDAVTEQLTSLAALPHQPQASPDHRRRGLLALLDAAARRRRSLGRRLLVVVDGIDEDTGPGAKEQSIAALLPRHPPAGVSVLVTSRPDRPLPADVPADHPLHHCDRHWLAASPYARNTEHFARREIQERLRAGPLHESLIGLVTASGGGLTGDDLAALTGSSPFTVTDLLSGPFGRSVAVRVRQPDDAAPEYVLACRRLRDAAEHELGTQLALHRARLNAWCEDHRRRGWPAETPSYLLHDHPRVLAAVDDAARLTDLAADPQRHERLLEVTGGDAAALHEITLAQVVGARRAEPDLVAAVLLAIRREEIVGRNQHIPVRLPAVWAALGRRERAAALARGLTKRRRRAALAAAALAAAAAGHLDDAEALAGQVPDRDRYHAVLATMAVAAAAHDPARPNAGRGGPRRSAGRMPWPGSPRRSRPGTRNGAGDRRRPGGRARCVRNRVAVVVAAVVVGDPGRLDAPVDGTARGAARDRRRAELAAALADVGAVGPAEEITAGTRRAAARLPALAALVRAAVARGDDRAALPHLDALRAAARAVANRGEAVGALLSLVGAVAGDSPAVATRLLDEAEHLVANGIRDTQREWAYARLAVAHAAGATVNVARSCWTG
ncbi:hypothetical protein BJF90_16975 [Pseudonocardia sp. CNS-004]|nr:hypothetical protein BJF90_16975 [Pseudonocardia sp. CNS-004]